MLAIEFEYYDKILIGITSALLMGVLAGVLTSLAFSTGVLFGALAATPFVYDAMFRNPPLPSSNPEVAVAVIVWHAFLFVLVAAVYGG